MEYKRFGSRYMLRLDRGEELLSSVMAFVEQTGILAGSVMGIGAVDRCIVGLFEVKTRTYHSVEFSGDMEITALLGNISRLDDKPYLHLHITLTDEKHQAIGGHLNSATISGTCEIIVDAIESKVEREFNPSVGLNTLKF